MDKGTIQKGTEPCVQTSHYSWDFAQQVFIPHHSQQVGPIYFKTPRKCEVFGVCSEGSEKQIFYLADEGLAPGKGANTVISYVHHYLQTYGLREMTAQFHFDNCCGQNKNNAVLWYAMWRVMTGLHVNIHYSLMVAGHTKFSPDWHFGLWKSRWRRVDAETIEDVADSVSQSSRNGHNIPHIANDEANPVIFYDWKSFLGAFFKPLKNISKFHSFVVSASKPGVVICKEFADSQERAFSLLRNGVHIEAGVMPHEVHSPGLDADRQWYLYDNIRQYFRSDPAKDKTCPLPKIAKSTSSKKLKVST